MKLDRHIKRFIKSSIYETGIIELKIMVDLYGVDAVNRALKIIDFIRVKKNLILKRMYANCTKVYSNYYLWDHKRLKQSGYSKEGNFYIYRDFANIA